MISHTDISDSDLHLLIRQKRVAIAGNKNEQIYGTLRCRSGMRMKKRSRVFFSSPEEALSLGYRPCAHCMPGEYLEWKNGIAIS